jgi:hypothetical protein
MAYPQTGSTLTLPSGQNVTSTSLSTNILITVRSANGKYIPVGAIQTIHITETRPIQMIDEVGTDGHIDSTPNKSTNITFDCDRIRYEKLRIAEAFSRSFMHVSSQVYPFDIVILDKQKYATGSQVSTVIKNVWIKSINYQYQQDNWVITDKMSCEAEGIYSTVNGGPAAVGGQIGQQSFMQGNTNWIEVAADMGQNGRRGSLDAAGLIDIGTSNYGAVNTKSIY